MNYSGSFTWQIPSGLPATVDAIEYMTLRNERALHNINGGSPVFNDQQFEDYRTGKLQSTDWYPLVFSNFAPQTMHNLNAVGGNERTTYYAGLGYQYQEGFFASNDLNYTKYNVRSNITTKITDRLTFDLNLNSIMDQQDRPYQDSWWIIRGFWRQGAHIPAYANNDPTKLYHGLIEGDNPLSFMDRDICGYKKYNKKWIQSAASLKYDIPGVKGLYVKGLFSYDYYVSSSDLYQKEYTQYRYDAASDTYSKFVRQSPNRIRREAYFKAQTLAQASVNYDNTFGKHKVGGLMLWEAQKRTSDNFFAQRDLVLQLPYMFAGIAEGQQATMNAGADALYENSNLALAGRFNYAFSDKYLAEFLFRYDGSSRFAEGSQWGFFPAASLGWRVSEENFFKSLTALSFINQFKIRSSYGKTGDDNASSYQFVSGYNYPTSTSNRNFTGGYVFNGSFNASADNKGIPNPNITWYTAETFDIGTDIEAWHGLLGVSADYFSRLRDGLLATRSGGIPTVVGAGLPQENLNSDRTYGFELEVSHRNKIRDLSYNVKGMLSLARVKRLYVERDAIGSSWSNWRNNQNDRLQGVHQGYQGMGQYQSWEEILASPTYIGRSTIVGDYAYEDWNGDGEINGNDSHPIRYNQYPWMNFSMIFDANYKGFDLNFLLQGSAMSSLIYGEQLREPMWGSGDSGAMEQFMDRWHPADPKADPYDPATQWIPGHYAYTGTLPDVNSTFNVENGAYLRLKSVELGYTLPEKWMTKAGIKNLRVYANAYNLFTITKVKYVDPEHPNDTYGYLYPLNKSVSVGLNVKF
jgi:TonB-linked SusC/RagA family outer membrane protein